MKEFKELKASKSSERPKGPKGPKMDPSTQDRLEVLEYMDKIKPFDCDDTIDFFADLGFALIKDDQEFLDMLTL